MSVAADNAFQRRKLSHLSGKLTEHLSYVGTCCAHSWRRRPVGLGKTGKYGLISCTGVPSTGIRALISELRSLSGTRYPARRNERHASWGGTWSACTLPVRVPPKTGADELLAASRRPSSDDEKRKAPTVAERFRARTASARL
ncbi:hypothetical protein KCP76_14925 [Salmonella enterica subsp. enterica serovar Weltevreden]|nr:hypothetical protein KCP76_14925 [Salmonella enterica subsp. enterica serovar Weltevreden]